MMKFVSAARALTAIFRQSAPQEPLTMEGIVADWSITETGAAPG